MRMHGEGVKRYVRAALFVVIVLAIAVMTPVTCARLCRGADVAGFRPLVVLGGSMEPTIRVGSVVLTRRVDPEDIRSGEVITFRTPASDGDDPGLSDTLTTHRVTAIVQSDGELAFRTKGDGNEPEDSWLIPARAVVGRAVLAVPYLGYLSALPKTRLGYVALILIPGLTLIVLEVRSLMLAWRRRTGFRETEPEAGG